VDALLWVVALALLGAVLWLSLGPMPAVVEDFRLSDKLLHAAGYALLTFVWLLAATWRPGRGLGRWPLSAPLVVGAFLALGGTLELIQARFDRSADVLDWLADCLGVAVGAFLWRWLWVREARRSG
jgi:hypothetical protein